MYRPGNLYLDESKAFYKSLNCGELRKGSLLSFLNPWSTVRSPVLFTTSLRL